MAPSLNRKPIAKDRFPSVFSALKAQSYHDPGSRGPGSHTIRTVAWNPTGQLIATGSADRTLRIWNPDKPHVKNSTELRGHAHGIERVAWNPTKEAELASVSSDGTCRFWDVRSKSCVATVQLGGDSLTVCWSADGKWVMAGRKDEVLIPISTLPTPRAQSPIPQPMQTNQLTFSHTTPPSHLLLTRGDGSVLITRFTAPTAPDTQVVLQPLYTLNAHTSSCLSLALSPSGRHLAIGGSDALISIYSTHTWACVRTITSSIGAVKSVSFSWDGSYLIGGCDEGAGLEVVHVESGEVMGKLELENKGVPGLVHASGGAMAGGGQVAWHPARYLVAFAGEGPGGGLRILGAGGGVV